MASQATQQAVTKHSRSFATHSDPGAFMVPFHFSHGDLVGQFIGPSLGLHGAFMVPFHFSHGDLGGQFIGPSLGLHGAFMVPVHFSHGDLAGLGPSLGSLGFIGPNFGAQWVGPVGGQGPRGVHRRGPGGGPDRPREVTHGAGDGTGEGKEGPMNPRRAQEWPQGGLGSSLGLHWAFIGPSLGLHWAFIGLCHPGPCVAHWVGPVGGRGPRGVHRRGPEGPDRPREVTHEAGDGTVEGREGPLNPMRAQEWPQGGPSRGPGKAHTRPQKGPREGPDRPRETSQKAQEGTGRAQ